MTYPSRPEADLHVHTVASGHAYSTIGEIALEAKARGLKMVGMTDHGPGLPGGPHPYHFMALRFVPEVLHGVRVLRGIEANVMADGQIDLEDALLAKLDLVMVGFHEECGFDERGAEANTAAVLALMEDPRIHVLTHPGNPNFPLDYEAVARAGAATGTALEINNSSFTVSRKGSDANCRELARHCARFGTPVCVGSDAHIAQGVGEFEAALEVMAECGIAWEQVINRTAAATLDFLKLES